MLNARWVLLLSVILLSHHAMAQGKTELRFHFFNVAGDAEAAFAEEVEIIDSTAIDGAIQHRLYILYESGYLAATYSLRQEEQGKAAVDFVTGPVYRTAVISKGNLPEEMLNRTAYKVDAFKNAPFSHKRLVKVMEDILDYAENHGYPFATVKLDSIKITGNDITAAINYQGGFMVVFDSLSITGTTKVNARYLMSFLGIYKGRQYEERQVEQIALKLSILPYLRLIGRPEILIAKGKCTIILNLEAVRINKVDAVLGLLPNQKGENQMLITGMADLDLQNLFGSGKQIAFHWQRFDVESQLLNAGYYHPNLLRTPINFRLGLDLMKQDTSFLNRSFDLELSLLSLKSSFIGFSTKFFSSTLISTSGYDQETLQENADNNVTMYTLKYRLARFDDITFPVSGWGTGISMSVGQKKIIKNPSVNDTYYDQLILNSLQYSIEGEIEKYWRLYKNIVLKSKFSGGFLSADQMFQSDLYRLGGLTSIRGFSEKSLFATGFGIINLEARAMLGKGTYAMVFFDQAMITDTFDGKAADFPIGTGAGLNFNTSAGTFNFVLAMGKSATQPFGFNYSKIHFGYISRF